METVFNFKDQMTQARDLLVTQINDLTKLMKDNDTARLKDVETANVEFKAKLHDIEQKYQNLNSPYLTQIEEFRTNIASLNRAIGALCIGTKQNNEPKVDNTELVYGTVLDFLESNKTYGATLHEITSYVDNKKLFDPKKNSTSVMINILSNLTKRGQVEKVQRGKDVRYLLTDAEENRRRLQLKRFVYNFLMSNKGKASSVDEIYTATQTQKHFSGIKPRNVRGVLLGLSHGKSIVLSKNNNREEYVAV